MCAYVCCVTDRVANVLVTINKECDCFGAKYFLGDFFTKGMATSQRLKLAPQQPLNL